MVLRSLLPLIIALFLGWNSKLHRKYLLNTFLCTLITIIFTLTYIYPINDILMFKAGGDKSTEEIKSMVSNWILSDRVRFAINLVGYFFL